MSIWYYAKVKDTDGQWHFKTGTSRDQLTLQRRFKDKRNYMDFEYIETLQFSNEDIKLVENSKNFEFENEILSNFDNVEIICTGENLGYGKGNNFGLKSTRTDYALILNPDLTCDNKFFSNIINVLESARDFTIIGCQYQKDKIFLPEFNLGI